MEQSQGWYGLLAGHVFSEDSVIGRVVKTQQEPALGLRKEPEHGQWCMPQARVQLAQPGPCYYLLLNKNMRGSKSSVLAWPQFVKPGDSCYGRVVLLAEGC